VGKDSLPAIRRYSLWIGFGAALVALSVLLFLQYRWLRQLESTSMRAHNATLLSYVGTVANEVRYFYRSDGERVLNVPAALFNQPDLAAVGHHFATRSPLGARRLFAVSFLPGGPPQPMVFGSCSRVPATVGDDEIRAIEVATAPWRTLAARGVAVDQVDLASDERDRAHRMILNPITDEAGRIVGVAGMILDPRYFRERVLPLAVQRAAHAVNIPGEHRDPFVAVLNVGGQVVWAPVDKEAAGEPSPPSPWEVTQRLSFAFSDWRVVARGRRGLPTQWADRNFKLNFGLTALLAASLLGGLSLSVRAASREMTLARLKSDFVSNVSHELRTPLSSIRLFAELLRLGRVEAGDKVRQYGEHIDAESRRLSQLIHNLLDFASMEAGHKTYHRAEVDLVALVEDVLHSYAVRLEELTFRLRWEPPREAVPHVMVDRDAFVSAFSNLLDNAIKYSGTSRDITVELATRNREAVLIVRDCGIGIPRHEQRRIFERFHRVSTGLVQEVGGSGLGLAIVRHIVQGHGGRVTVESAPGQGSAFAIHLPIPADQAGLPEPDHSLLPAAHRADSYGAS
jgi:signal transduction histidine kinase